MTDDELRKHTAALKAHLAVLLFNLHSVAAAAGQMATALETLTASLAEQTTDHE